MGFAVKKTVLATFICYIICSPSQGVSDDWEDSKAAFTAAVRKTQLQDDVGTINAALRTLYPNIVSNMDEPAIDAALKDGTLVQRVREAFNIPLDFYLCDEEMHNLDFWARHKRHLYETIHRL